MIFTFLYIVICNANLEDLTICFRLDSEFVRSKPLVGLGLVRLKLSGLVLGPVQPPEFESLFAL